jgi:hypothetical protein
MDAPAIDRESRPGDGAASTLKNGSKNALAIVHDSE